MAEAWSWENSGRNQNDLWLRHILQPQWAGFCKQQNHTLIISFCGLEINSAKQKDDARQYLILFGFNFKKVFSCAKTYLLTLQLTNSNGCFPCSKAITFQIIDWWGIGAQPHRLLFRLPGGGGGDICPPPTRTTPPKIRLPKGISQKFRRFVLTPTPSGHARDLHTSEPGLAGWGHPSRNGTWWKQKCASSCSLKKTRKKSHRKCQSTQKQPGWPEVTKSGQEQSELARCGWLSCRYCLSSLCHWPKNIGLSVF